MMRVRPMAGLAGVLAGVAALQGQAATETIFEAAATCNLTRGTIIPKAVAGLQNGTLK